MPKQVWDTRNDQHEMQHVILMDQLFSCWSEKDCCSFLVGERTMRD